LFWLAGNVNSSASINIVDAGKTVARFIYGDAAPFGHYWNYYWAGDMRTTNTAPSMPMSLTIGVGNLGNLVQGIFGQCTGDFNGNFAPGVMKSASESLTLDYGQNVIVDENTEFELPVYAGMDMKVGAVSLIMDFPSDDVEITDIFLTSDPSSALQYNVEGDELRISWYSLAPIWLNEGEGLVTLKMKMKTSTEEGIYFSLVDSQLNELADGEFDVFDATLIIDIPSKSALGFGNNNVVAENIELSNQPNPFNGTTTITYSIPANGEVTLEIYDMIGNKVKVGVDATQDAGNMDVAESGMYMVVLNLRDDMVKLSVKPAEVYGIGDAFGGYDPEDNPATLFTIENVAKTLTSPALTADGAIRMYAQHSWIPAWWNAEFNVYSGIIEYRNDSEADQDPVNGTTGQVVTLMFDDNTGTIQ